MDNSCFWVGVQPVFFIFKKKKLHYTLPPPLTACTFFHQPVLVSNIFKKDIVRIK